ncbi:MAG TPA: pyridoxine 5'-phosphate synthase [Bacteroidota bacterium]|nr:pyridoxine 5'-phosphate synthase [Bacteroidota bacterium]
MKLSINIDHIATLRNARGGMEPDPVAAAMICESIGVDGIVVHLREDRRHIMDRDVRLLRQTVVSKLDLEMAASEEIISIALDIVPEMVTLVPEKRAELTTEGGLDVRGQCDALRAAVDRFHEKNILVSMFVDPDGEQIEASYTTGADMIELHTGTFANARTDAEARSLLEELRTGARHAKRLGMGVNAGHGLNYRNVKPIVEIGEIDELSIGHAIMSRAIFAGLEQAVKEMAALVKR